MLAEQLQVLLEFIEAMARMAAQDDIDPVASVEMPVPIGDQCRCMEVFPIVDPGY
jgi:hypothetical protein